MGSPGRPDRASSNGGKRGKMADGDLRVALYGGTFDPIHYGHLLPAEEVCEAYGFDRFWFIPAARPPHKQDDPQRASPDERFEMVRLAVMGHPTFRVSRSEIDRTGKSYAIDTVREFQARYGPDATIYWILGADALIDFDVWKDGETLLEICRFVAMTRPRYDLSRVPKHVRERVEFFTVTGIDLSSTEIRARIAAGKSIRYRTPPAVIDYIERHGLYRIKNR